MSDPLLELADALVAALAAANLPQAITATWQASHEMSLDSPDLAELPQVWVVDAGEALPAAYASSAAQAGLPVEEFDLLVVVQKKLENQAAPESECRQLSGLVSAIARFCRRTILLDAACYEVKRPGSRDLSALRGDGLYRAFIHTSWRRVFDDEED